MSSPRISRTSPGLRDGSASGGWLRLSAAAELLGLSHWTLRRWADDGRVPCHRLNGGQRRFLREELERLVADASRPSRDAKGPASAPLAPRSAEPRPPSPRRGRDEDRDGGRRKPREARPDATRERVLVELLRLAGTITHQQDLYQFARVVAQRLHDMLRVVECDVFLKESGVLRYLASVDADGLDEDVVGRTVRLEDYPLGAAALDEGVPLVVASPDDPRLTPYERHELTGYGLASELCIPLVAHDRTLGCIDIYDDKPRDYAGVADLIAGVAQMLAGTLESVLLAEQVERRTAALRELVALGEAASQTSDMDTLLVGVAERLLKVLDVADCDIFRLASDGELRCLVSLDRNGRDEGAEGWPIGADDLGASAGVVESGVLHVVASRNDPGLTEQDLQIFDEFGFESEICVPLFAGDAVVGLILMYDDHPRDFAESLDFLRHVSQLVGGAYEKARLLERQTEQTAQLATLLESSRSVAATGRLEDALATVARLTADCLDAPECMIVEYDNAAETLTPRALFDRREGPWDGLGVPKTIGDHPAEQRLLSEGGVLEEHLGDESLDPASRRSMQTWGQKTCLTVPVVFGQERKGLIVVCEHERERHFTRTEIDLVGALGEQAAAAIHSAQMFRRLEERNRRLEALARAGRVVSAAGDVPEALRELARLAAEALDASSCVIWAYDEASATITERAVSPLEPEGDYVLKSWTLEDDDWGSMRVLSEGVIVEERISDPDLSPTVRASMEQWGEKTCLSAPLLYADGPIGLLLLTETRRERQFSEEERAFAAAIGKQAAAALHGERQIAELAAHNRRLAALLDAGRATTSTLVADEVLSTIVRKAAEALGSSSCVIFEYVADRATLIERQAFDAEGKYVADGVEVALTEYPEQAAPLFADGPIVETLSDPSLNAASRESMLRWGEATCLSVPLVFGDERLGVLVFSEMDGERVYTAGELSLAGGMAEQAAIALHNARLYESLTTRNEELAARVRRERFVSDASVELSSSLDLDHILRSAAQRFAEQFDVRACDIYRLDGDAAFVCVASFLDGEHYEDWIGRRLTLAEASYEAQAVASRKTILMRVDDPRLSEAERAGMDEWGEKSILVIPLVAKDRVLGTVALIEAREDRVFTDDEIAAAEAVCRMTALALDNGDLFAQQVEDARRLAALLDASRATTSTLVVDEVLARLARKAAETLESSSCVIYEYVPERHVLVERSAFDRLKDYEVTGAEIDVAAWPDQAALLFADGPVVEALSDPDISPLSRASMEQWGEKTCLSVPLFFGDERLGLLVFTEEERERAYTQAELDLASAIAEQASVAIHNARLFEELDLRSVETQVLNDIARRAASSLNVPEIAAAALERLQSLVPFDRASLLVRADGTWEEAFALDRAAMHAAEDGDAAAGIPRLAPPAGAPRLATLGEDVLEELRRELVVIVESPDSTAYVALPGDDELLGVLKLTRAEGCAYPARTRGLLAGAGSHLALAMKNALLYENVRRLHLANLKALSSALLAKDYYTIGHTARVATYAVMLARELGWSQQAIDSLEEVAFLHDIGKIAVPDRVLLKTGPLTDDEWGLMRQHPVVSAEIIEPLFDESLVAGVRHHHERYGGGGYPDGLAGEKIPEIARLMAVVDAYDAMSSRRIYRGALSSAECVEELRRCSGTHFDPAMATAFERVLHRMRERRLEATRAAETAARRIDPAKHALLRRPADAELPEYTEIRSILAEVMAAHPRVDVISTQVLFDEQRKMMVVDSDPHDETRSAIGAMLFADAEELDLFAGRQPDSNVVYVDSWGAWISGNALVRSEEGEVEALVSADLAAHPGEWRGIGSDVAEAYQALARFAADRLTKAEVEASTDALTSLYNHRKLQQRLDEALQLAPDDAQQLSLLFLDVDHFKELNDEFGHAAGDHVLRRIADIVRRSTRPTDMASRYGGDELAVLLVDTDVEAACEVGERIRREVEQAALHPGGGSLTVSVGIAMFPADADSRERLIELADAAMYVSKRDGRNRCTRAAGMEPIERTAPPMESRLPA